MHRRLRRVGLAPVLLLIPGLCLAAPSAVHGRRHGVRHGAHTAIAPLNTSAARPLKAYAPRSYAAVWRPAGEDRMPTLVSYGLGPDGLAASFGFQASTDARPTERQPFVPSDPRPIGTGGLLGAALIYRFR